jgi:hypothetical protein
LSPLGEPVLIEEGGRIFTLFGQLLFRIFFIRKFPVADLSIRVSDLLTGTRGSIDPLQGASGFINPEEQANFMVMQPPFQKGLFFGTRTLKEACIILKFRQNQLQNYQRILASRQRYELCTVFRNLLIFKVGGCCF